MHNKMKEEFKKIACLINALIKFNNKQFHRSYFLT